jgi:hypothetical protein
MCCCQATTSLVVSETIKNIFLCTNSQFFSGLTTAMGQISVLDISAGISMIHYETGEFHFLKPG